VIAQLVAALRYKPESRGRHWHFLLTRYFRPHYGPGVDSAASNNNEHQEISKGVKAAGS